MHALWRVRSLLLSVGLLHSACLAGCSDDSAAASKTQQPASSPEQKTLSPVKGAHLRGEALDKDGDGKVETWHRHDSEGNLVIATDTDGDGVADVQSVVRASAELPPGFKVEGKKTEALRPVKTLGPEPPK